MHSIILAVLISAASLLLFACGGDVSNSGSTASTSVSSSIAPPEALPQHAENKMALPPAGWNAGLTWIVAVHDRRKQGPSSLEVDWVRFYCTVNGVETMVSGEYPGNATGVVWSGLYKRNPWFDNDTHESTGINFTSDIATLLLDSKPENVFHFGTPQVTIPAGATKCYAKARVKPVGNTLVQIGVDFWKEVGVNWCGLDQCNTEGSASDWYQAGSDGDFIVITSGL